MTLLAVAVLLQQQQLPVIRFDWTLNVGNVAIVVIILVVVYKLLPLYRLLLAWQAEHELFLKDYAERHHMTLKQVHALAMARINNERKAKAAGHS